MDIPLPSLGIDILASQTALKSGTVRAATNVDIRHDGAFSRRDGFSTVAPGTGYCGLHASPRGVLVGQGTDLFTLNTTNYTKTKLCSMGVEAPIDFTEYNEHTYICGPEILWWIPGSGNSGVRPVGVRLPDRLPVITPSPLGTLTPGKYGLAYSRLDDRGEESATQFMGTFDLTAGVTLSGLEVRSGYRHRLYITPCNGDALFLADEWDALMGSHSATVTPDGAPCTTLHLAPMPPGNFVRGDKGRLYVAAGDTLWFSMAMRPHLTDLRHNFIKFVGDIRFMEIVNFGMYVGDDRGVWWLAGTDPDKFELQSVSDALPIKRSSLTVLTSNLGEQFAKGENNYAVWLSTHGYMVGSVRGEVTPLHPERVRLAADLEGKSVFLTRNGVKQIITLTAAAPSAVPIFGAAIDLPLQ